MVLEFLTQIFSQLQQANSILLFIVFFVFLILAYKLFQTVIKALIIGVIAAAFPFVANMFGFNIPITLSNVLWFAIFGVVLYFAYAFISGGVKIIKIIFSPFKVLFRKKEKKK
ncbi:MAG: hypothetical protein JSW41_02990 [Candidatus Aenigmatarchaeota archaeon]|nr:MAG: hypothetical protein JSW41_02990 [Candidatus Aenigmarchaeota archaeon]